MRIVLLIIGLLLLGGGVALGLVPSTATTAVNATVAGPARTDTFSCGSPWMPDQSAAEHQQGVNDLAANMATVAGTPTVAENAAALCVTALGSRGMFGGTLAGLGAVTLLGVGLVVAVQQGQRRQPLAGPIGAES